MAMLNESNQHLVQFPADFCSTDFFDTLKQFDHGLSHNYSHRLGPSSQFDQFFDRTIADDQIFTLDLSPFNFKTESWDAGRICHELGYLDPTTFNFLYHLAAEHRTGMMSHDAQFDKITLERMTPRYPMYPVTPPPPKTAYRGEQVVVMEYMTPPPPGYKLDSEEFKNVSLGISATLYTTVRYVPKPKIIVVGMTKETFDSLDIGRVAVSEVIDSFVDADEVVQRFYNLPPEMTGVLLVQTWPPVQDKSAFDFYRYLNEISSVVIPFPIKSIVDNTEIDK